MQNKAIKFISENATVILTISAITGLIGTVFLGATAAPKASKKIKEAEDKKGDDLTILETVKVAGPVFIPTAISAVSTIVCIVGISYSYNKRYGELAASYAALQTQFNGYRNGVRKKYGNSVDVELAESKVVPYSDFTDGCVLYDPNVDDSEERLFYDTITERYFNSKYGSVVHQLYLLNRKYVEVGLCTVNDYCKRLQIECVDEGDYNGWGIVLQGYNNVLWIDFAIELITIDDLECLYITPRYQPQLLVMGVDMVEEPR